MKTYFYKILYKKEKVVYIGVTTRTIDKRFKEHMLYKGLNPDIYTVIEFYSIEHPEINTIEIFMSERIKVSKLEQKYIQEEKNKGSNLLNISKGGEWGTSILNKLRKEKFFETYGSYDNYKEYMCKKQKCKRWLKHFIEHRSENKCKPWLMHFVIHRSENKCKVWLRSFVECRSKNKCKTWLKCLVNGRSKNKLKAWLRNFVLSRSKNKCKYWLSNFTSDRSKNKCKIWLRSFVLNRTKNNK